MKSIVIEDTGESGKTKGFLEIGIKRGFHGGGGCLPSKVIYFKIL